MFKFNHVVYTIIKTKVTYYLGQLFTITSSTLTSYFIAIYAMYTVQDAPFRSKNSLYIMWDRYLKLDIVLQTISKVNRYNFMHNIARQINVLKFT